MTTTPYKEKEKLKFNMQIRVLLVIGIILVAVNLRPAITAVGPLIGIIRDDLGLSNWIVGFLTSLPLLAFALLSNVIPIISKRLTIERTMMTGLLALLIGMAIRSISYSLLLFLGTILLGAGIAACNVLLPAVIKENFPLKVGLMTSIYSTIMVIFSAVSSAVSVPLAKGLDWGWQWTLFAWSVPVVLAIIIWFVIIKSKNETISEHNERHTQKGSQKMWRSPLAWQVALYMGFQSILFYITISWLPELLLQYGSDGVSMTTAGWMLSYSLFAGLPATFIVPVVAERFLNQSWMAVLLGILSVIGYGGLLFGQSMTMLIISATLIGTSLNGTFSLALTFIALRVKRTQEASELSGMAQSIGYSLAAVGPVFIGLLFDLFGNWDIPLIALMTISLLVILFGVGAGRNRYVFE